MAHLQEKGVVKYTWTIAAKSIPVFPIYKSPLKPSWNNPVD
jgi:hypothetical protein